MKLLDSLQSNYFFKCIFLKHPEEQSMTYFEHLKHACYYGIQALSCSLAFFVHGVVPSLFEKTGSTLIKNIHDQLNENVKEKEKVN